MLFELTSFGLSKSRKQSTGVSGAAEEVDCFLPALEFVLRNHHNRPGFAVNAKWLASRLVHVLGRVLAEFVVGHVPGHVGYLRHQHNPPRLKTPARPNLMASDVAAC